MTTTNIPAMKLVACDSCGAECSLKNYIHEGKLTLTRAALDYQGNPVADATIRLDLCDRCNAVIGDAINVAVLAAKEQP